jgi:cytochrome c biogenesis protein CcdA
MEEWIKQVFEAPEFGLMVLPAGLLFGLITSFACIGCSAPLIAAVLGYAGSREGEQQRDMFLIAGFFMLGTVLAFSAAGWAVGFIGQSVSTAFGFWGKIIIAILAIFFGFVALNLLPFRLPSLTPATAKLPPGMLGASIFGLGVGVVSVTYTMGCCGPILLPVVLGVAALKGEGGWGALILAMFAVGYSLPLVAAILGVGLGKLTGFFHKIAGPIQKLSGVLLIIAGIWLLFTL